MSADLLLSKLEKVKQTGPGTWKARCPAHDDRSPSLAIREVEDGKVLIRCFAECGAAEIVAAVGLELSDLFPPRPIDDRTGAMRDGKYQYRGGKDYSTSVRRPFNASPWAILEALADETLIASLASRMLIEFFAKLLERFPESDLKWFDVCLSQETHERLILASSRIERGRQLVNGCEFSQDRAQKGATYCDALTVAKAAAISGGSHVAA